MFTLIQRNPRAPGPPGIPRTYRTPEDAIQAAEEWKASMGWYGYEMACLAGLEVVGPNGLEWKARK